jgi:hypothetical protein
LKCATLVVLHDQPWRRRHPWEKATIIGIDLAKRGLPSSCGVEGRPAGIAQAALDLNLTGWRAPDGVGGQNGLLSLVFCSNKCHSAAHRLQTPKDMVWAAAGRRFRQIAARSSLRDRAACAKQGLVAPEKPLSIAFRRRPAASDHEAMGRVMDTAYISAISALAGSVIGGLTSGFTTWLSQRSRRGQAWSRTIWRVAKI